MTDQRVDPISVPAQRPGRSGPAAADVTPATIEAAVRPRPWQRYGPRLALLSPIVVLLLWELLSQAGALDRRFFPPPSQVVGQLGDARTQARLPADIVASLSRILVGFSIGSVLGALLGLWLGLFRTPRMLLTPVLAALYPVPKLALFPLLLMLFGLGDQSKWAAIAIGAFFLVFYNTLSGVLQIPTIYLDVARNAGASRFQVFRTVALPASAPDIFTGLKLATGTAFVVLAAVEFVGGRVGLGTFLWSSWQTLQVDRMYLAIVLFAILGFAAITFVSWVEARLVPWARR
jgi:NitT/TauT family transport system permease protein